MHKDSLETSVDETAGPVVTQLPLVAVPAPHEPLAERRHKTMSDKQLEANRRNGALGTGPRTIEGKRKSALNSLRHGLTARTILLPGEEPAQFEGFKLGIELYWAPEGEQEASLVLFIVHLIW